MEVNADMADREEGCAEASQAVETQGDDITSAFANNVV